MGAMEQVAPLAVWGEPGEVWLGQQRQVGGDKVGRGRKGKGGGLHAGLVRGRSLGKEWAEAGQGERKRADPTGKEKKKKE